MPAQTNARHGAGTAVPLAPVDRAWLRMDEPGNLMQITGVLALDGAVSVERVREVFSERLARIPRFRQRIVWRGTTPCWEDDPDFDVARHVVPEELPPLSGEGALAVLVGRLLGEPLDREHPLWVFHVASNYRGGTAVVGRLHHAIGDGVALLMVLLSLTDLEPEGSAADNLFLKLFCDPGHSAEAAVTLAREVLPETMRLLTAPLEAARRAGRLRMGLGIAKALVGLTFQPADRPSALRGPLGATKQAAWTDAIPLDEVKAVAAALGGTVNDVLLAAMTGAFRAYLARRAGETPRHGLRAAVPVSLRPLGDLAALGNRFGLLFLGLPVRTADPVARFHELRRRAERLKRSAAPWATLGFLRALGHLPAAGQRWAVRFFGSKATAVMTNVPGPARPLYLGGRRIHEFFFWVPQSGRAGIGISILSYAGDVRVGIATDQGLVPDPETLVQSFYEELELLRAAAGVSGAGGGARG
jgi:WS/DGAT/MGAT family acyltransferase